MSCSRRALARHRQSGGEATGRASARRASVIEAQRQLCARILHKKQTHAVSLRIARAQAKVSCLLLAVVQRGQGTGEQQPAGGSYSARGRQHAGRR